MEIRNLNQYQQMPQTLSGKSSSDGAVFFNTTDAFKPGTPEDKPLPDLKKAANVLFKQENMEMKDIWENETHGIVYAANASRVILGSYNDEVKAVDPVDGKSLWKTNTKGFVKEGKDGTLYVSGPNKSINALDPRTGQEIWSKSFESQVKIFDQGDDGTLYASSGGKVIALDPNTRKITAECKVVGDPAIGKNGMVFGGGPDAHKVTAYDLKTGEQKWEAKTEGMVRCAPAIGKDGTVFVGMVKTNNMIALDPETGKEKWSFKASGGIVISPVVGKDGTVYLGDIGRPSHLYAIDPDTGKEKWSFEGKDDFRNGIAFLPDGTITAPTGCDLNAINPDTGNLRWSKKAKSYLFAPPVAGTEGKLYFGTNGKGMHCIRDSAVLNSELEKNTTDGEAAQKENPQITRGEGFIEIGGVKVEVRKKSTEGSEK